MGIFIMMVLHVALSWCPTRIFLLGASNKLDSVKKTELHQNRSSGSPKLGSSGNALGMNGNRGA